jgi:hypothetical protein
MQSATPHVVQQYIDLEEWQKMQKRLWPTPTRWLFSSVKVVLYCKPAPDWNQRHFFRYDIVSGTLLKPWSQFSAWGIKPSSRISLLAIILCSCWQDSAVDLNASMANLKVTRTTLNVLIYAVAHQLMILVRDPVYFRWLPLRISEFQSNWKRLLETVLRNPCVYRLFFSIVVSDLLFVAIHCKSTALLDILAYSSFSWTSSFVWWFTDYSYWEKCLM